MKPNFYYTQLNWHVFDWSFWNHTEAFKEHPMIFVIVAEHSFCLPYISDYAIINLANVSAQQMLEITHGYLSFSTTFFVPYCNFTTPGIGVWTVIVLIKACVWLCQLTTYNVTPFNLEGEVDVGTLFPLSRFGKGENFVNISFAVMGANSTKAVSPVVWFVL